MKDTVLRMLRVREEVGRSWYLGLAGLSFTLAFVVWLVLSAGGYVNPTFLPAPGKVLDRFAGLVTGSDLWPDVGISIYRVTAGFLLAAVIGVPLGILAGAYRAAGAFILPLAEFIRYMPAGAFIPLVMLWAGIGETAKILIIFIGSFFQLLLMVAGDAQRVSLDLLKASYTLGATQWQVLRRVLWPAMLPSLIDTLRLIIGWAWTYLVVAELVAANSGLGFRIMKAQRFFQTDTIFAGIILIGLVGLATDWGFRFLRRRLFPWAEGEGA